MAFNLTFPLSKKGKNVYLLIIATKLKDLLEYLSFPFLVVLSENARPCWRSVFC